MGKSFSARLSLNILLIVSILFIIALSIVAVSSHGLIADEATKSATHILEATISDIEKDLQMVEMATYSTAWYATEHRDDEEAIYHATSQLVEIIPYIVGSTLAFAEPTGGQRFYAPYSYKDPQSGEIRRMKLGSDQYDYFKMEWFSVAYETGKAHWSEPYYDDGGSKYLMSTFSIPVRDENGKVFAVLTADVPLTWIEKRMEAIHPYEHSYAMMTSRKGKVLNGEMSGKSISSLTAGIKDQRAMKLYEDMSKGKYGYTRFRSERQISFAIYGALQNGWNVIISSQYRDVLQRSSQMHLVLILVGLFGLLVMVIICYRTIRRMTRPITELSVSALNMAKGNFQAKLPEIRTNDEMQLLHDSFSYMQKSLTNYIAELKTTTAQNERMESELNVARSIQKGMLSRDFPERLYAFLEPAKEVGGDLYDFFIMDNALHFAVGDVSGKGVPAALVMAITRAAFRFIASMNVSMEQVISHINNSVAGGNESNMFVTMFVGRIDLATGDFQYCNAGHNPIIVIPPMADAYYLKAKANLAVGLIENFPYQGERMHLENGTRLLIYTDGVSEAETREKELFGDDRLLAWAGKTERSISEKDFVEGLYSAVKQFTAGNEANDDITIMSFTV